MHLKASNLAPRPRYGHGGIALVLLLLVLRATPALSAQAEATKLELDRRETRFERTVWYMQNAAPQLRAEFTMAALNELAAAYAMEAELARQELLATEPDEKLRSWSVEVDRFAGQLLLLVDEVEQAYPLYLLRIGPASFAVKVNDRTVILSHPRVDQQSTFEQSILLDFCAGHACEQFTPGGEKPEPIPVSTAHVRPDWNFTETGPICSYQHIRVLFANAAQLARSRLTCEQFMHEAMMLSDEIAWQQRHAVSIAWDTLAIHATPGRPQHRVQLNPAGDSILVVLPILHGSPGLLAQLVPWMRGRLESGKPVSLEVDAAAYGWD